MEIIQQKILKTILFMINLFKKQKDYFQVEVPNACSSQAEKSQIISETLRLLEHKLIIIKNYE